MSNFNYSNFRWSWYDFCGTTNEFSVWNSYHGDLDICFQYLCLHIPILSCIAILSAYYSGFQVQFVRRRSLEIWILRLRSFSTFLLFLLPIIRAYVEVSLYPGTLHAVNYLVTAVESFTWLIHFSFIVVLKSRLGPSLRGPVFLGVLWSFNFILCCILLRSQVIIKHDPDNLLFLSGLPLSFSAIQVTLHVLYLITLLPSEGVHPAEVSQSGDRSPSLGQYVRFAELQEPDYLGVAGEDANFLSKATFSWVTPLLKKGYSCTIDSCDDLFDLPASLTSSYLYMKLLSGLTEDSLYGTQRVTLFKALHTAFWKQFYGIGIFRFVADLSTLFGPLLLNRMVTFIENGKEPIENGVLYALGMFSVTLISAFCDPQFNYLMSKVSLKIRGALITTIYRKMLTVSSKTLSSFSEGEIINFMSIDTDRIVSSCPSFHAFWSIPFRLFVTLYLLYQQIGLSFLAGVVFSIILIPVNKCIASKIGSLSTKMMIEKDNRILVMTEIIKGIRAIKLYVWENVFSNRVKGIRKKELKYLAGRKLLDALCVYFWATTPVLISIMTFSTYVYAGNKLTAPVVFTTMALLNMLIAPLNSFPWVLNGLTEAWVSLKRVQQLLNLPEQGLEDYYSSYSDTVVSGKIIIQDGYFHWGDESSFKLQDINFTAKQGKFIGITGPVGSGKSSLLATILAEIDKTSGSVLCSDIDIGFGYVSQTPWLQRGSVKSNILFGEAYDSQKYCKVLEACALLEDLEHMSDGDQTNVGDSGSMLSGGQKVRISLARAAYKDVSIYLFDDIFAAVDLRVATHILNKCILGLLKNKTRIICTHQPKFLIDTDWVIVMKEGYIVNQGPPSSTLPDYDEIMTNSELGVEEPQGNSTLKPEAGTVDTEDSSEERATGTLDFGVYSKYLSSVGLVLFCFILLSVSFMQASRNLVDWWLAHWVSLVSNHTSSLTDSTFFMKAFGYLDQKDDTSWYLKVYFGLASINSITTLLRATLFAIGGLIAAHKLHESLFSSVILAPCLFFDVTPFGRIVNRFSSDVYTIDDSLPFISNILLAQFFNVLGTLFMTLYGLPWLCLLLAPIIPIYHWLQNHYRLTSREIKRLTSVSLSPLYNHFTETMQGLVTIRAFRSSSRLKEDVWCYLEVSQKALLCSSAIGQWLNFRLQIIGVSIVTGVALLSVAQHHVNVADPGLIGLALSYALMVTSSLNGLISSFTETEREMVAVERVKQYFEDPLTLSSTQKATVPVPFAWPPLGLVTFQSVSLKYREHYPNALKGISFETRPAEKVGIVGRTGAGKSSLVSALFRLTDICGGAIYIDGINIYDVTPTQLRSRMGVIPQQAFIFKGTVRENIDPEGDKTDSEIWVALNRAHLTQTISALTNGLDAVIKPSSFSAGQQQLLSLARAILRTPKVVCIDEATANIDEETDKLIQQSIRSSFRQTTVLTIAHRLTTVLDYDRVIVMGGGKILEFDNPNILLENHDSHFYKMFHRID